jgi:hypothetical protein
VMSTSKVRLSRSNFLIALIGAVGMCRVSHQRLLLLSPAEYVDSGAKIGSLMGIFIQVSEYRTGSSNWRFRRPLERWLDSGKTHGGVQMGFRSAPCTLGLPSQIWRSPRR